jgi:flagellar basal-body rod protein FlgB
MEVHMIDSFNQNIDMLQKSLEGLWKRNEIISNNIANVESADYKAKDIDFEQVLRKYVDKKDSVQPIDARKIQFSILERKGLSIKENGNNVNVETEMVSLAENKMKYDLATEALRSQLELLRTVIEESKG